METKTLVLVAVIGLAAAGILGGLLTMLKPQSVRESEMVTAPSAAAFPSRAASRAADEPAADLPAPGAMPAAAPAPDPSLASGGSLSFVRGGAGMSAGAAAGPGGPSAEAAAAAARGDAKGLVAGLQGGDAGAAERKATRAVMQKVVDAVHRAQPMWYKEFLANSQLKAIADTYDKGRDFGAFLRQLAKSPAFKGMLRRRANTSQLRGLTKRLLDDPDMGPQLSQLFMANTKDPAVVGTVREFGAGAGLPAELLQFVGVQVKSFVKPTLQPGRPMLKPSSFGSGGFGSNSSFGSQRQQQQGDQPQTPSGVDPQMLQQYQKYMQK